MHKHLRKYFKEVKLFVNPDGMSGYMKRKLIESILSDLKGELDDPEGKVVFVKVKGKVIDETEAVKSKLVYMAAPLIIKNDLTHC